MSDTQELEEGWYWVRPLWREEGYEGSGWQPAAIHMDSYSKKALVFIIKDEIGFSVEEFEIGPRLHPPGEGGEK